MEFKQRMKKDKFFRYGVFILLLISLSFLVSNTSPKKEARESWEICYSHNTLAWPLDWNGYTWPETGQRYVQTVDLTHRDDCRADGCFVGRVENTFWSDKETCVPYVPVGWLIQEQYGSEGCIYGVHEEHNHNWIGSDWDICKDVPEEDRINDREAEIAGVLDDLGLDTGDMSPKTKYYLVIFGGGFMALMLIGTIL